MQAWGNCIAWLIDNNNPLFSYTAQTQTFAHWWQEIDKKFKKLNAIPFEALPTYFIKEHIPSHYSKVVWACFDELTPLQVRYKEYLETNGVEQLQFDLPEQSTKPQVFAAKNTAEEYQALAMWLKQKLDEGKQSICVVAPELQNIAKELQSALTKQIPETLLDNSLGKPLSQFTIVAHAQAWLELDENSCTQHQATMLLHSPYLKGANAEFLARSKVLQDSSLLLRPQFSLKNLATAVKPSAPTLSGLLANIKPYPSSASPKQWISLFQERLNYLGFPGDYGLNSEQYQCHQRFTTLFDEFRTLYVICPVISKSEALFWFKKLASQTIFQAQKTNAPIQICGLLEASGCTFDDLWIMGLTNQCLPRKTKLSPFIPLTLQKQLRLPYTDPIREYQLAEQTLRRLFQGSANSIVLSYPKLQKDTPNLPSTLIEGYKPYMPVTEPAYLSPQQDLWLQEINEYYQVPLLLNEQILGGTALLSNQAKCPFKAFAEHRLKAKALPQTQEGIDYRDRGKIVHKVMELLWRELKNQHTLLTLNAQALDNLVETAINTACTLLLKDQSALPSVVLEVETNRLKRLVYQCLAFEKQRPNFEVSALEQSFSYDLQGLNVQVQVDRIDKVLDNQWVIDYKTTLPASKPWNEQRPQEVQLLLYALLNNTIDTILFLQLKTGDIQCSGLSAQKHPVPGIAPLKGYASFDEATTVWRQLLCNLAEEILNGHCIPEPVSPSICQHCDYKNLCRI